MNNVSSCPVCQKQIPADSKFCVFCGADVTAPQSPAAEAQAPFQQNPGGYQQPSEGMQQNQPYEQPYSEQPLATPTYAPQEPQQPIVEQPQQHGYTAPQPEPAEQAPYVQQGVPQEPTYATGPQEPKGQDFCTACGGELKANDVFCAKCGAPVAITPQPQPTAAAPAPQYAPAPNMQQPQQTWQQPGAAAVKTKRKLTTTQITLIAVASVLVLAGILSVVFFVIIPGGKKGAKLKGNDIYEGFSAYVDEDDVYDLYGNPNDIRYYGDTETIYSYDIAHLGIDGVLDVWIDDDDGFDFAVWEASLDPSEADDIIKSIMDYYDNKHGKHDIYDLFDSIDSYRWYPTSDKNIRIRLDVDYDTYDGKVDIEIWYS